MLGNVKFNEDGTLNISVAKLPDVKTAVFLPNAEIYVPKKLQEEKKVKKESNWATIGIIVGAVILIFFVIAIIIAIGTCLYRQKKSQQPIPPPKIVVRKPEVARTPNPSPPLPPAAPEPAPKLPQTPVQPTPTPIPKPVEPKPPMLAVKTPTPSAEVAASLPPSPSTEPVERPNKIRGRWQGRSRNAEENSIGGNYGTDERRHRGSAGKARERSETVSESREDADRNGAISADSEIQRTSEGKKGCYTGSMSGTRTSLRAPLQRP